MLDDLLGRTELKERIEELEDEVESLESQLEAENRRRKEAVTEKQDAERRANKLESKIDELRDRVERAESEDTDVEFRVVENLRLDETSSLLRLLGSVEGDEEELTTVYVPPEDEIDDVFGSASGRARRSFEDFDKDTVGLLRKASESESTVVVFDSKGVVRVCLTPPREVERSSVEMGSEFALDRTRFVPSSNFALCVVRSDTYSGGVYEASDGETDRVAVSHHSSNVKSKHSKGGFSQSRFERLREEQVEEHIDESVEEFEEMLENSETEAEFTVVCGESNVVERFSDRLGTELRVETRAVDARGEKEELLRAGFERFWRTRLHVF